MNKIALPGAVLVSVAFGWILFGAAGCAEINVEAQGTRPSDEKLASVTDGVTSRDAVVAVFGVPQYIRVLDDGREQLIYEYRERETKETYFPLLFKKGFQKTRITRTYFEVANGIVMRHWKDGS
jgi:hypothetical protein